MRTETYLVSLCARGTEETCLFPTHVGYVCLELLGRLALVVHVVPQMGSLHGLKHACIGYRDNIRSEVSRRRELSPRVLSRDHTVWLFRVRISKLWSSDEYKDDDMKWDGRRGLILSGAGELSCGDLKQVVSAIGSDYDVN